MQLTQRLRHSSTICASLDTEWPAFQQPPIEQQALGGLLEKSAECYAYVMPLVEAYYTRLNTNRPKTAEEHDLIIQEFAPGVLAAKKSIKEYCQMLDPMTERNAGMFQSCAEAGFPFSPIIRFVNPHMAQPTVIPHIFVMFLAPFISDKEHYEAIRFISGVFAGFTDVAGLRMDAAFPDLYVAAFWKRGEERDYFRFEVENRSGDFPYVLGRIWGTIDYLEETENRLLSKTEILGISLREYRKAQAADMRLQHTRH